MEVNITLSFYHDIAILGAFVKTVSFLSARLLWTRLPSSLETESKICPGCAGQVAYAPVANKKHLWRREEGEHKVHPYDLLIIYGLVV